MTTDTAHRKKINNEALRVIETLIVKELDAPLAASSKAEVVARLIITAIAKGEIPHIKIGY